MCMNVISQPNGRPVLDSPSFVRPAGTDQDLTLHSSASGESVIQVHNINNCK